jgi:uncharacterized protein (TIGR00255 family)
VIRSMTGFASVDREDAGQRATLTVKTVNHRFLDIQVKMSSALGRIDAALKGLVQQRLTRGRVEIHLSWDQLDAATREVVLNEQLLSQINAAVERAREQGLVSGALSASDLCRIPHVLEVRAIDQPDSLTESAVTFIEDTLAEALDALVVMRQTEGRFLATDLDNRLATMLVFVDTIEQAAASGQAAMETRLRERLAALPSDLQLDPAAATQEIVRFVARSDIHEEVSRMRGHVEHWRHLAGGPEPCGRKLDFLVQEMNREINTIGSKAEGLKVTELVVAAKAELERIREQVQNVE